MACAVWDLLFENSEDPVTGVKFHGIFDYSHPEIVEFNILRKVRKMSSRIMTLDFRRGVFGELLGRIAQEAALRSTGVQES